MNIILLLLSEMKTDVSDSIKLYVFSEGKLVKVSSQ